jgi:ABC-type nitrate/sulfonate/bicarbonate transport system permease component
VIALLLAWEGAVRATHTPVWLLPGPWRILAAAWETRGLLLWHTLHTLRAAALGTLLAVGSGVALGALIQACPALRYNLYPLLVASQTVPTIIVAPLLTLWFGYGILPKVLLVGLACFFPVAVGVIDGLSAADPDLVALARTMDATPARLFWKIRWPAALPSLFTGLRVALTYAVIATVVAEWMGADAGLGVYLTRSSHSYLTDRVFAAIAVVSALSLLLFWSVNRLAARVMPWHLANHQRQEG